MKNYFENETTILPFDKVLSIHKNKDFLYICIGFDKGNGIGSNFPLDQLTNYKSWLDSQSNKLEKEELETMFIVANEMKAELGKDGNQWCYIVGNLPEPDCIVGFGDTPKEALSAFYNEWKNIRINKPNTSEIPTSCSCSGKDTSKDVVLTRMQAKSVLSVLESIAIQKNTALEDAYNVLKDRLGNVSKVYQSYYTCSEKANDSNNPKNSALKMIKEMQVTKQSNGTEIPQVKWLIECWEAVYGREFDKLTDDDTTVEFLEDFLHDCLGILDYAGALNNINKGDLGNHLPDVGKMVLSRDILQTIVDKVGCIYCTVDHLSQDCKNCYNYSNIKISDDFVKEINDLINEV